MRAAGGSAWLLVVRTCNFPSTRRGVVPPRGRWQHHSPLVQFRGDRRANCCRIDACTFRRNRNWCAVAKKRLLRPCFFQGPLACASGCKTLASKSNSLPISGARPPAANNLVERRSTDSNYASRSGQSKQLPSYFGSQTHPGAAHPGPRATAGQVPTRADRRSREKRAAQPKWAPSSKPSIQMMCTATSSSSSMEKRAARRAKLW